MSSSPPSPTTGTSGSAVPLPHYFRVCVTGAAGNISYLLLNRLPRQQWARTLELFLLDIPPAMEALRGVVMELEDCGLPQLRGIVATDIPKVAFQDADLVILLGSSPRKPGLESPDILENNIALYREQGKLIDQVASRNVKVLVVSNPCNTNAWVCREHAPSIPAKNFTALSRLDFNRAIAFVAARLAVDPSQVRSLVVWGNHASQRIAADLGVAFVNNYPAQGHRTLLTDILRENTAPFLAELNKVTILLASVCYWDLTLLCFALVLVWSSSFETGLPSSKPRSRRSHG